MNTRWGHPQISVIGTAKPDEESRSLAYEVGRLLGNEGATIICGGGGGVMYEAARGLREAEGGVTVGILKDSTHGGNKYLDIVIPTGFGHARNLPNVLAGKAVVAVSGRYGTLSEIAFARIHDRPVFGINTWDHPEFDFPTSLYPETAVRQALETTHSNSDSAP